MTAANRPQAGTTRSSATSPKVVYSAMTTPCPAGKGLSTDDLGHWSVAPVARSFATRPVRMFQTSSCWPDWRTPSTLVSKICSCPAPWTHRAGSYWLAVTSKWPPNASEGPFPAPQTDVTAMQTGPAPRRERATDETRGPWVPRYPIPVPGVSTRPPGNLVLSIGSRTSSPPRSRASWHWWPTTGTSITWIRRRAGPATGYPVAGPGRENNVRPGRPRRRHDPA